MYSVLLEMTIGSGSLYILDTTVRTDLPGDSIYWDHDENGYFDVEDIEAGTTYYISFKSFSYGDIDYDDEVLL